MTVTLARTLPDAMKVAREVLLASGAPCGPDVPPDLAKMLADFGPRFTLYRFGGTADRSLLMDRANMFLIAWDLTYEGARDLAETGRTLLHRAWRNHWQGTQGRIVGWTELVAPAQREDPNMPDGVWRFDQQVRLTIRPNP